MNKLTAEKCREWIEIFNELEKDESLSIAGESHLQAYRMALLILEQQELREGGWIEWGGGECPVDINCLVNVRYKNGGEDLESKPAEVYNWHHDDSCYPIIAYRIIPERATNQNGEQ